MNGICRSDYGDIIALPHHVSPDRPHMSNHDRAAQFAPFAALTGYDDYIREEARLTNHRVETGEDAAAEINAALMLIAGSVDSKPFASVTYFVPDAFKKGGEYVEVSGKIDSVDEYERTLRFADGRTVPIDFICGVRCDEE